MDVVYVQYKSVIARIWREIGYNADITLTIGYNAVWEGEESLIPLIFSSPAVRVLTDLYCSQTSPHWLLMPHQKRGFVTFFSTQIRYQLVKLSYISTPFWENLYFLLPSLALTLGIKSPIKIDGAFGKSLCYSCSVPSLAHSHARSLCTEIAYETARTIRGTH